MRRAPSALVGLAAAATAAGAAADIWLRSRRAEAEFPPVGDVFQIGAISMRAIDQGQGSPILILHGNGGMIREMAASGLIDRLSGRHRVVVPDRPGYGYTERPRGSNFTPERQAALFVELLDRLGIERAVVMGHSWGTLPAVAMALDHPDRVAGLVLASGYYFPKSGLDSVIFGSATIPIAGDILRWTVGGLTAPAVARRVSADGFSPDPVSPAFRKGYPIDLASRPLSLRAAAEEGAMMQPAAGRMAPRYASLDKPVLVLVGENDRIVDPDQSKRLHATVPGSELRVFRGRGHMLHHVEPDAVADAVETFMERTLPDRSSSEIEGFHPGLRVAVAGRRA